MLVLAQTLIIILIVPTCFTDDQKYVINNGRFPKGFFFGVASAAYQIEGGWDEDGKGPSMWDYYTHTYPDKIVDHTNADISCDSFHKYKEDVAMMKEVGVNLYRFSFAWTRILPNGLRESFNEKGVQFYKNLISELRANNIEPLVTLYHNDLPQALQDKGGFLSDSFPEWFADYARVCFEQFGDDVKLWSTFNEPSLTCPSGYGKGDYPPEVVYSGIGDYICGHNVIKAHARAYHLYDEEFRNRQHGRISIVPSINFPLPQSNSTEDIEAAKIKIEFDLGWLTNPVVHGDYPELMKIRVANRSKLEGFSKSRLPEFTEEEKAYNKKTTDFIAVNAYATCYVYPMQEPPANSTPSIVQDCGVEVVWPDMLKNGPGGLTKTLVWIKDHYDNPDIIVVENGYGLLADDLDDFERIDYVKRSMSRFKDAVDQHGVKLLGYTLWSLFDNFEWRQGYTVKFGIYRVDFNSPNRTRTARASAEWYKKCIETRCLTDECVD